MSKGQLYLIPSSLGNDNPSLHLSSFTLQLVNELNHFVVEDEKIARRYLRSIGMKRPFEEIQLAALNEHTKPEEISSLLAPAIKGEHIGLMSDAGSPAVADPGSELVRVAHEKGIRVVPLAGPSSILLALMASGLNGQQFRFCGYLPRERKDRIAAIKQMETVIARTGESHIFMDTPYRNMHVLEDLMNECKPQTMLCIATSIHFTNEMINTKSISDWKKKIPDLNKKPVMFVLGR